MLGWEHGSGEFTISGRGERRGLGISATDCWLGHTGVWNVGVDEGSTTAGSGFTVEDAIVCPLGL